jgi:DNA repair protein RecO (recombination protein O)
MPQVRTPAIILHSFPYGDTSRILRVLTPDHGVRSLLAKGARAPKGRFGGILEPFTEGEALFNLREGRELLTLSGFSLVRSRQGIGRQLDRFAGASLLAEIVLRFATEEANPPLYSLVLGALDGLATDPPDALTTSLTAVWSVVGILGFQPQLESCVRCGEDLPAGAHTRFDVDAGGVVCLRCKPEGRRVPPDVRAQVLAICSGREVEVPPGDRKTHGDLFHAFLAAHLMHGRPLRSLPLFLEQFR